MERWLPVIGHEGAYEVSDQGRVRSVDRIVINAPGPKHPNGQARRLRGQILRSWPDKWGYPVTRFGKGSHARPIHQIVLEAFVGPCPAGMETRHLDGRKSNNALANLCWGTDQQNCEDRSKHGTKQRGGTHSHAKLTEADVRAIKASIATTRALSEEFGVAYTAVWSIRAGKNWRGVQP